MWTLLLGLWGCTSSTTTAADSGAAVATDSGTTEHVTGPGTTGDTGETDAAGYLFDPAQVRTYEVVLDPADWAALQDDPAAEVYVPGQLLFEGQVIDGVSLRYKGSYGSLFWCVDRDGERIPGGALGDQPCSKLSMKLAFDEVDPEGRFYGVRKLAFNAGDADPSHMRERLGYAMFAAADVPAPRAVHAWLIVNGEPQGLFTLVETIDGRFARARFAEEGGEGNVYKEVWPIGSDLGDWQDGLKTNRDEDPDFAPALAFSRDLEAALAVGTTDGLLAALDTWTDRDAFFRFLAVDRAVENWDGIMAWYGGRNAYNHNYYWYQESAGTRLHLVPWDVDRSLVVPNPIVADYGMPRWNDDPGDCGVITVFKGVSARAPGCDPFIAALAHQGWEAYAAASRTLLDTTMTAEAVETLLATWEAQIADRVAEDATGPSPEAWAQAMVDLREDVALLRAEIDRQVR